MLSLVIHVCRPLGAELLRVLVRPISGPTLFSGLWRPHTPTSVDTTTLVHILSLPYTLELLIAVYTHIHHAPRALSSLGLRDDSRLDPQSNQIDEREGLFGGKVAVTSPFQLHLSPDGHLQPGHRGKEGLSEGSQP